MALTRFANLSLLTVALAALQACSGGSEGPAEAVQQDTAAAQADARACEPDPGIDYVCGPLNAEDLVRIGDGPWLLSSGMDGTMTGAGHTGHLYLINSNTREHVELLPGGAPVFAHDTARFGSCPGPLDLGHFSMHGLALHQRRGSNAGTYDVYATNHGARESVEVFELDARGDRPALRWIGCVPMPETAWTNAVAVLPDGGLVVTKFVGTGESIAPVMAGEVTGHVLHWQPGGDVEVLPGTDMSGANGVLVDDEYVYVAEMGRSRVLRFDLENTSRPPDEIPLGIRPDNLRWTDSGTILTVGPDLPAADCTADCDTGWSVYEVDPIGMTGERIAGAGPDARLQAPSTALRVGEELWVGTYAGDRIGIMPDR